jgi:hypothetical protein
VAAWERKPHPAESPNSGRRLSWVVETSLCDETRRESPPLIPNGGINGPPAPFSIGRRGSLFSEVIYGDGSVVPDHGALNHGCLR